MTIRISRNAAGNCINFVGSSLPAYFNACLSGEVDADDNTLVSVVNDIQTASNPNGEIRYEFYQIPYTEFADTDGNPFPDAQAAADYITQEGRVLGVSDTGTDLTGIVVNFRLDDTSTSIIMDNGAAFGVNTIKAVPDTDGTIHIHAIGAGVPEDSNEPDDHKHYEKLEASNVQINGVAVAGGLSDVCNALNELFTVGAFESVVVSDPYSTMIADVGGVAAGYTLEGSGAIDPSGNDIFTNTSTGNYAGLKSTATIDQAGEYFSFSIRGEGQIGFGLVHTDESYAAGSYQGNANYADPASFAVSNSAHYGYQFSHWFHPTPNGSWTNYGASTGIVYGPGWYNWESQTDWLAGNPVKIKVGIDENGFIAISSQQNDGSWILHARSSYPVPQGSVFHLGIKSANPAARVYTEPKVHLLAAEVTAPTDLGDQTITVFEDNTGDIAGTLAGGIQFAGTDDNRDNDGFVTTETISDIGDFFQFEWAGGLGDAKVGLFSDQDHAVADLQADRTEWGSDDYIYFGTRLESSGVIRNLYYENGSHTTLASGDADGYGRVGFDAEGRPTIWYSADGITWTAFGRLNQSVPTGTYRFIWIAQGGGDITSLTKGTQSFAPVMYFRYIESPDGNYEWPLFATAEEANYYDANHQGTVGTGTSHTHTYADDPTNTTWYMPDTGSTMTDASAPSGVTFMGAPAAFTEITSLTDSDLTPTVFSASDITQEEGTAINLSVTPAGATWSTSVNISPSGSGLVYDSGAGLIQGTLADVGADTVYTVTVVRANSYGSSTGTMTITATDVAPVQTNLTPWTKALDFSGSNENALQVSPSSSANALRMQGLASLVPANADPSKTSDSSYSRPWATAVVFKYDGSSSNQHIWNSGEGAGSTDDNIYLRIDSAGNLYFGWGRQGAVNECKIVYLGTSTNTNHWHGIYIAHKGTRLSGTNATAANLAAAFDIRWFTTNYTGGVFGSWMDNKSTTANWITTGGRMDRSVTGNFTVGGRGSNRSFHGKVASMVLTHLKLDSDMPTDAEIELMVTDPKKWEDDYRVGQTVRQSFGITNATYSPSNLYSGYGNTQIWLMGDGASDSYSNMIRNDVFPSDQNYTKLNMISMVSNDIQTVNINGLS